MAGVSGPSIWDAGHHTKPDANAHAASVGVRMKDGGSLVSRQIADELLQSATASMDAIVFELLRDKRTWEQRLADAIEQRSIRNRIRRRTYTLRDMPRRLRNARAALAGEWEADDYR
jgi:hypothetical protein